VARIVIVGCGCRGRALAHSLIEDGHAVRGTTREAGIGGHRAEIEATGAEAYVGDPDRIGTLVGALDGATVLCVLLGSARGSAARLAALHGSRLEMLLERLLDTTVRAVVYEAAGSVDAAALGAGEASVLAACEWSRIPYAFLKADPGEHDAWLLAARQAVDESLTERRPRETPGPA
jgi:nucleoside-diphosphate-sugar epimerase